MPSSHQPSRRAWHLLLHIIVTVTDVGQSHLTDCDGAPVAIDSAAPSSGTRRPRHPGVQQPELCKEKLNSASLLAGFRGCHALQLGRQWYRKLDALARLEECGPSVDEHVAARARPVLLVAGVIGVHVANQLQRVWPIVELQGGVTSVGKVGEAVIDLAPVLVAPHREATPQLAASKGNVRPRRHRCKLQRANLLPVLILLSLPCLLIVERQLGVGVDGDRRLGGAPNLLLVDVPPAQLVGVALLVQPQLPYLPVVHDLQPEVLLH
ncbi:unnamed protein product [Closterium sp. NIES-54]